MKNLEQISEEIHKTRAADLGLTPPGPREPGVGAELCTDYDEEETTAAMYKDEYRLKNGRNPMTQSTYNNKMPIKNMNMPIADLINQYEKDYSLETASMDTNSLFSEDKDDEDYNQGIEDTMNTPRKECCSGITNNSRNEPVNAMCDNHELNLEELRQKVKVLAVRPVEGGDGQTKDCWESELNETVNKLDRLMMLQENNSNTRINTANTTRIPTSVLKLSTAPITNVNSNGIEKYQQQKAINESLQSHNNHMAPKSITNSSVGNSSTTKTFLNNSLQAVQQKMEGLTTQTSSTVMQNISSMKELPLLSRISNEISANTANTVKVLKRRLSLN